MEELLEDFLEASFLDELLEDQFLEEFSNESSFFKYFSKELMKDSLEKCKYKSRILDHSERTWFRQSYSEEWK